LNIRALPNRMHLDAVLFLILLICTLVAAAFQVTFIYGITFGFTSIFLFLILRIFGFPLAILSTLLSFLIVQNISMNIGSFILLLTEIFFVGAYFHIKKRVKMFFVDAFFWGTIGLFILFFMNNSIFHGEALYFQISKEVLNGLFNVLVADMLLAYFPFYKFVKSVPLSRNNVSIHQFISHITILAIMVPFFILVLSKTWAGYEFSSEYAEREAKKLASQIEKELLIIDSQPAPGGTKESIEKIIEDYKSPDFTISISDKNNKIISSSSSAGKTAEIYQENGTYNRRVVTSDLFEVIPKLKTGTPPILEWREGSLVFIKKLDSQSQKVYISYPISNFQDQMFSEFLMHLRFSIIFILITVVILVIVDRMLMKNIKQLMHITTGLSSKVLNQEKVDWPVSFISELRFLTQNLMEMSQNLRDSFQQSSEMNRILSSQASKLKESEEQLHNLAYYDALTSLPNRLYFQRYVRKLIDQSPDTFGIIFMDLNRFKQVNDTLGHDAGDTLLKMTAEKLRKLRCEGREIFRLGGDEFVIVNQVNELEEINLTLESIHEELISPVIIDGHVLYISGSFGVSLYPFDGKELNTLVKCADVAMYASKEVGGKPQYYDESMRDKFLEKLLLENSLRKVVENGGFELFYQPKIRDGKVSSVEALLRWQDPCLGNVSPSIFIPHAEEIGVISKIDKWTLFEACRQNKKWQDEHSLRLPVSVNISANTLKQSDLLLWIKKALDETNLQPEFLKIEITESVLIKNPHDVAEVISRINALGVMISIDDFGKGYSSLFNLLQLPFDEIKIDRKFVRELDKNEKQQIMVECIIKLAHKLNLNIVAEGVETKSESDLLVKMGCDELQGYLYCPPVSSTNLLEFYNENVAVEKDTFYVGSIHHTTD
jgi:diguanylate cyclase (GGDEF)-like protein